MKIGIIGAGQIGSTLARKFIALGHTVKLANSRGPETLAALAAELGASAVEVSDAVRAVDVVVVAIQQPRVAQLTKDLFSTLPSSVPVIDTGNYYPRLRDTEIAALEEGSVTESRWVAQQLGRPVIKAFNNITAYSLAQPAAQIALPVAGDDAQAKALVLALVESLGYGAVDAGSLDDSWRQQPGTPVYCTNYDVDGVRLGLTQANRERAPYLRDLGIEKFMQLPPDNTEEDRIRVARSLR
jgi:predicted dinucleotide-binding enzyme